MKHLFSPYKIKNCTLGNRIVMPSLASFLIANDGTVTERTIEHYRLRAAGGPGMVVMEACAVSIEGMVSTHQGRIYDDRFIEGLSKIAEVMKSEGTVPAAQIHHAGRQTSVKLIKRKPLAPSPLPCPAIRGDVEPLTIDGIQQLVAKFGDAAERLVEAGFELIEIHGAHGYLINQFLSRFSNIREDRYGGDIGGRTRFAREIVEEIRRRLNQDFPLSFKISAQEFCENGLSVEESIEILKILLTAGIDVVQVSAGNDATPEWISQPMFMEKGCLVPSAEKIRQALNAPVMAVGRINDAVIAEKIIRDEKADLVCIGRGLMADPEFPKKAKEGRLDDIRTCIACNTCMQSIYRKGRIECLVNPALGREKEMVFHPTKKPKKVMVIGAGPGGLNVAWVAAKRGHNVHLFEKEPVPGGQLNLGTVMRYKNELKSLIRFQKAQIEKYGVSCHYNVNVTEDTVESEDPDVVVLATGALPLLPETEDFSKELVVPFPDALNRCITGRKSVVIGGGQTGCEVALHLSEKGGKVTIVEMLPVAGKGFEAITRKIFFQKMRLNKVKIMTESTLLRVEDKGVRVAGADGVETFLDAEMVVFAVGSKPDKGLAERIKKLGFEVHLIGDCLEPRSAKAAIYEGAVLGRSI